MKITGRITGLFTKPGLTAYEKKLFDAKKLALTQALSPAVQGTKKDLANAARGVFKVRSKTFGQMFTAKLYTKKKERLPATLFYTRSPYFSIFEFGGVIKPKKGQQGILIPFEINGKIPKKKEFFQLVNNLHRQNKTFFKKVNGNLLLFAIADRTNSKSLTKFKRNFKSRKGLKNVKGGTAIPLGIFKKSVTIKRRFAFTRLATNSFLPKLLFNFALKLKLK